VEPALLLTLAGGPTHGYDLAEQLTEVIGAERIDYGNLYRLLRRLEGEEIVSSQWNDDLPGRSKRTYSLTPSGAQLLEAWAAALEVTREGISEFLNTYTERSK
jgi:poly-beta-hydroxybutyrate-responsive repressor